MREAERLARTCTNGVANQAKMDYYKVNKDIIQGVIYTSVIDGRTSEICISRDGNKYSNIDDAPALPAHINCRSLYTLYLDKFGIVGNRVAIGEKNFRQESRKEYFNKFSAKGLSQQEIRDRWKNLSNSTINSYMNKERKKYANEIGREIIGKVPAEIKYPDWLKKQPRSFVEETLGKTKAKLFLDGNMPVTKFIARDNSTLTLKELYAKDKEVFKQAGVKKP